MVQVFIHTYNPLDEAQSTQTMMSWRERSMGQDSSFTANQGRAGSGGRVVYFLVAFAFNEGFILSKQSFGNINGDIFAQFIKDHFN